MSPSRLALSLLVLAFLDSVTPALAGGTLTSGVTTSGSVAGPSFTDSWTFSGTSGQRILVAAVTTSGSMNTVASLFPPGGGPAQVSTASDRWDFQLTQTGTYTLEISDQGLNDAGTYAITWLNLTAGPLTHAGDLDGDGIASGEVRSGTISGVADLDAFTFSGTAGQRVLFAALESTAPPFNTVMTLYGPNGGGVEASTSGGNRLDVQLAATGTYTVVVDDVAEDTPGSYVVSYLNVTGGPHTTLADPDGGAIPSATSTTGTMNGVVDWDAFTVSGSIGDRVIVTAVTTSGAMNTNVYLYPPNGGPAQVATASDRWDFQLTQNGTHTVVVEDTNFGETGSYTIGYLNLTSGPLTYAGDLDGDSIASGEVRSGTISGVADLDAFTFSGAAGQRVLFAALESTAPPFNTVMTLYGPNGGGIEASTGGGNRLDAQLAATGTYTVVVDDVAEDTPGSYVVSYLNVTGGPHTTLADPDGGAIPSATIATGTMNGVVDWDAFTFNGSIGDRIIVAAVTTSGAMNTNVYLYPPNGGPAQVLTAADRWDFQLTQSGTHTVVVEDSNFGDTGTYSIAYLNLTAGPLTHGGDLDGGAIASNEVRAGTIGAVADLDAFTFSGSAGQRVVIGGIATSGAPFNTVLSLYSPGGGPLVVNSSGGDRIDYQLASTGTYAIVVDDVADDHTGSYSLSFVNVSDGPVVDGGDLEGGWMVSGQVRTGNITPAPDFDVYWFDAQPGDTAKVNCFTTSGALNTTTYLYPPGGGSAVVSTSVDNWTYPIVASGRHALLVQHSDLTLTGGYQLGLSGPITSVDVPDALPAPSRLALSPAHPNPSRGPAAFILTLPRPDPVRMRVYDVRGALVRTLVDRALEPGAHSVAWDGRDDRGRDVASGVYLVAARVGGELLTRRVVRLE